MRTDRHILRREWENVRAAIARVIQEEHFAPTTFRSLSIYENWDAIEENIYHTFCKLTSPTTKPVWLWEQFKLDAFGVVVDYGSTCRILRKLIEPHETVWFFVNGDRDKFWFYEGQIDSILTVIGESYHLDELYIASKKYEWLLCITHHDVLYATGSSMPDRLRQLENN